MTPLTIPSLANEAMNSMMFFYDHNAKQIQKHTENVATFSNQLANKSLKIGGRMGRELPCDTVTNVSSFSIVAIALMMNSLLNWLTTSMTRWTIETAYRNCPLHSATIGAFPMHSW